MKKLYILLAMFLAVSLSTFAQDDVDLGRDYNGSSASNATSGSLFVSGTTAYTVYSGQTTEVKFTIGGGAATNNASNNVYTNSGTYICAALTTSQTYYLEGTITSNSDDKVITAVKVNGTTDNTSNPGQPAFLFSDEYPFNPNNITGYKVGSLPACRAGNNGQVVDGVDVPDGTKSFRVYRQVSIKETTTSGIYEINPTGDISLGTGRTLRLAYVRATLEDGAPATEPKIELTSAAATTTQTVYPNQSITSIVYKYGGTATAATIVWSPGGVTAPAGITVTPNTTAKTLTISGKPTAEGTYSYSITSTDGSLITSPLSGTLTVQDTDKKKLAYVTTLGDVRDDSFTNAFEASGKFAVTKIASSATGVDFDVFDIIVLSAVPNSGDAGLAELKLVSLTKPFLQMKTYQMQASRWNWCVPANTNQTTIVVPAAAKSHAIFDGIIFTGSGNDEIVVTTKESGNRVVKFPSLVSSSAQPTVLATAKGEADPAWSYAEIPVGTTLNAMSDPTQFSQIILGLSETAWDGLTADAITLAVNAAKYLTGGSSVNIESAAADNAGKTVVDKAYYDLTGRPAAKTAKGLLIQKSVYEDGTSAYSKVYIK
ncbi:hypothetical protein [Viscerimonas tarda]